jgi:hypothetical protein
MSWLAITLFKLRPERSVADFRAHSLESVRPGMMRLPSVLGFRDFAVTGTMAGTSPSCDAVELIEITDPASFERDNQGEQGALVTRDWLPWVESFEVLYCRNLAALGADGAAPTPDR